MASTDLHPHGKGLTSTAAGTEEVTVLRLHGEIDLANCPDLDHALRTGGEHIVVDLSDVTLLSAAAIGVLVARAQRVAEAGGQLRIANANPTVGQLLRLIGADRVLLRHDGPVTNAADHRVDAPFATDGQLRSEMVRLRSRLGTQPTIGRALGILQERYRLHDRDLAFDLLKTSSQRHNVRLHVLADAFVAAPRPSSTSEFWFPGRLRRAAPPLSFAPHQVARGTNRTAVLDALLDATLDCTETTTGGVRLIDLTSGDLHLERHRGLPVEFLHFFATRQEPPVGSRLALHRRAHVVIADVATDPILADHTERAAILATGIRSTQSSPLLTASRLLGVVSTYHPLPDHAPTTGQRQRLEAITTQGAAWLEWYRRTVVLDALEHVHQSARAARNTR